MMIMGEGNDLPCFQRVYSPTQSASTQSDSCLYVVIIALLPLLMFPV